MTRRFFPKLELSLCVFRGEPHSDVNGKGQYGLSPSLSVSRSFSLSGACSASSDAVVADASSAETVAPVSPVVASSPWEVSICVVRDSTLLLSGFEPIPSAPAVDVVVITDVPGLRADILEPSPGKACDAAADDVDAPILTLLILSPVDPAAVAACGQRESNKFLVALLNT